MTRRSLRWLLLALVVAACGRPGVTVIPASELPLDVYGAPVPARAGADGAADAFGAPPSPAVEIPERGTIYVVRRGRLSPLEVPLPAAGSLPESLLLALLAAEPERGRTAIPPDTRLIAVSVENGVATVDLSEEFEQEASGERLALRVAQVVYTVTEAPQVSSVLFSVEGRMTAVIAGEDQVVARRVTRADYEAFAPAG